MSYPWRDEDVRYPWDDDPVGVRPDPEPGPRYRPGGERRVELLRRIDPWSALKVSLVLYLACFAAALVFGVGLWILGRQVGFIDDVESLIEDLGLYREGSYRFLDGYILTMAAIIGPILAVVAALVTTIGVAIYNVIARVTGGLELTVIDAD